MMRFDSTSIYNRAVSKLQQNPDWKAITNNSVISSLLKSNSEIMAETARYAEYLFKESKWNTAQNNSSILAMANMLGYQPKRKISATGTLYVSADPKTHLVGKTIDFDAFKSLTSVTSISNLNWINNPYDKLSITPAATIKDSSGRQYTVVGSSVLEENSPYTQVNIIEGVLKSVYVDIDSIRNTYTVSKMYPYLYIPFIINNCENASSVSSRRYFKLHVMYSSGETITYKEYRIVDSLLLSDSTDYDVEVYNDLYNQNLFYAKFNNDTSMGPTLDVSSNSNIAGIRVDYLESSGASGNIDTLYNNFTISNSINSKTGSYSGINLYGINSSFILGGKDEETITEIKENATKFYISNYSVGTKESYEKTILNTSFRLSTKNGATGLEIKPKKVRVYGGEYTDKSSGLKQPVTYVSFISDNLEDVVTSSMKDETYTDIQDALNYYLAKLKSPQDTLKFQPPEYVPISLGLNCSIYSDRATRSLQSVEMDIQNLINSDWGPNSNSIDFGNDFIPSNLINSIKNNFDEVKSIDIEVEATKKLVWKEATRAATAEGTTVVHTCRIPFDFSPVFMGNHTTKGFKDFTVGSKYVLRLDLMYKKPSSLAGSDLNKTIFIGDPEARDSRSFYVIHDQDNLWPNKENIGNLRDYSSLLNSNLIPDKNCYQISMVKDIYTDSDFEDLLYKIENQEISTQSSLVNAGCLDNYIIYFSGSYDSSSESIGNGWVEFSFDAIYNLLQAFAIYDQTISAKLEACPLSVLKCDVFNEECFNTFINLITKYLDIYVSMRPIDSNLKLLDSSLDKDVLIKNNKSVIYIDSYDSNALTAGLSENLTATKKQRFISVKCKYEE